MTGERATIEPEMLVGKRVEGVVGSWYIHNDTGVHKLLHTWLKIAGLGHVQVHTLNGVRLHVADPHAPYDMAELGARVLVEAGTPVPVAAIVGQIIDGVRWLQVEPEGFRVGFVIETSVGSVAIADVGDDLWIGSWPDVERWSAAGIAVER